MPYPRSLQGDLFESNRPPPQIPPQDRAKLIALLQELLSQAVATPQAQADVKTQEEAGNE